MKKRISRQNNRIEAKKTAPNDTYGLPNQGVAWGGKDHWWFEIGPDSHWQEHWRGDTTERSRLLLQTMQKQEPDEIVPEEKENLEEKEARVTISLLVVYMVLVNLRSRGECKQEKLLRNRGRS